MFLKNPFNEIKIEFYSCVSSEIYNCFKIITVKEIFENRTTEL